MRASGDWWTACPKCNSLDRTRDGRCLPCRRIHFRQMDWKRKRLFYHGEPLRYDTFKAQFDKQLGRCATCDKPLDLDADKQSNSASADHDHVTGEFRGVLCWVCNTALNTSMTIEVLARMIQYLQQPPALEKL